MANVKALIKFRDILTEVINVLIRLDNYHFPTPSIVILKKYLTDIETYCQPADIIADIVQNDNYLQNKKLYLLPLEGLFKCDFGIGVINCNNIVYDFWNGLNERLEKEGFKECDIVEYTNLVQRIIHSIKDCLSGLKSDFAHIDIIKNTNNELFSSKELDTDEVLPKLEGQEQTESSQQTQVLSSTQADKTEFHNKVPKCKGRPKGTLKDKMICENAANMLSKLHQLMYGRKGKEAALIITACIKAGIMTKPTFRQVSDEFGDIGNQSGYNKNMGERPFTDMEIEAIIKKLKE